MRKILKIICVILLVILLIVAGAISMVLIDIHNCKKQYDENPTSENLYLLCDSSCGINDKLTIEFVPKLCFDGEIEKSESYNELSYEEQNEKFDSFLLDYLYAYSSAKGVDGLKECVDQIYSLVNNKDMLFYYIDLVFSTDTVYNSKETRISVLDSIYQSSKKTGNSVDIASAIVFAQTQIISYDLGNDLYDYYDKEYEKEVKLKPEK